MYILKITVKDHPVYFINRKEGMDMIYEVKLTEDISNAFKFKKSPTIKDIKYILTGWLSFTVKETDDSDIDVIKEIKDTLRELSRQDISKVLAAVKVEILKVKPVVEVLSSVSITEYKEEE